VRAVRRAAAVVAAIVAASVALSGCFLAPPAPIPTAAPDVEGVPEDLRPYYAQTIEWASCENDRFDCATVDAPRDWADPGAGDIELAIIRQRATGGEAIGSLLVNPGGPGVSGYDYVRDAIGVLAPQELQERYDVVAFDPRGVARSTPVECVGSAAEMDAFLYDIPDGERGSAEWDDASVAQAEAFADGCAERSGDLLPFVSTADTARDLDLLRGVLGDELLHYLGYSWGTALGATYAGLFPERVGRMVLDGAMDPSLPGSAVGAEQAIGFERSLNEFLADCAQWDDCPYSGSVDDMGADLAALLARLDRSPIPGPDGRMLGADTLLLGIIQSLYAQGSWPFLRGMLAQVEDGDAASAFTAADSYNRRVGGQYQDNSTEAFTAYNCMDYPAESAEAQQELVARVEAEAPVTAPYWFGADVCEFWPAEPTGVREPITADGAAPILVIGTTGDPATPYDWAVSLADQLTSGVLLTRVGEGHTGYTEGNPCVDAVVDAYLLEGTVPDGDVVCD
jgi:pimeloyl-ACP methyl ester carboxylesterase